jgi:hypothetical protein
MTDYAWYTEPTISNTDPMEGAVYLASTTGAITMGIGIIGSDATTVISKAWLLDLFRLRETLLLVTVMPVFTLMTAQLIQMLQEA